MARYSKWKKTSLKKFDKIKVTQPIVKKSIKKRYMCQFTVKFPKVSLTASALIGNLDQN